MGTEGRSPRSCAVSPVVGYLLVPLGPIGFSCVPSGTSSSQGVPRAPPCPKPKKQSQASGELAQEGLTTGAGVRGGDGAGRALQSSEVRRGRLGTCPAPGRAVLKGRQAAE